MNATNKKVTNLNLKTADDFYRFFSAIPEEKWCRGYVSKENGIHCILGHLGVFVKSNKYVVPTRQCKRNLFRLANIIQPLPASAIRTIGNVINILWQFNDRGDFVNNPRTKILAALAKHLIKQ